MSERPPLPDSKYAAKTGDDEGDNVRARFYPDFPAEVVVTHDDEIHLFTEGDHQVISMDSAEDIYKVLEHVGHIRDPTADDDNVVVNLAAFTGIFKFLAHTSQNQYLNPPDRMVSDYESPEDER